MTQLEYAKNNKLTPLVKKIAKTEGILPSKLLKYIKEGLVVIPLNLKRSSIKKPCAIGYSLRTKVNANLGTSTDKPSISEELEKLKIAVKYGSDTVMDLSVGPGIKKVRRQILRQSPIPVGTVPIYELAVGAQQSKGDFLSFDADDMLSVLEEQAKEGVDFFTVHCGVTRSSLAILEKQKRIMGI
ncbi:MAG: phosphomethylpyrimidine synthase ThiC, partial [bacterium]